MTTPKFIVIEGIDGSGKSTLAANLADRLRKAGQTVCLTREPYDLPPYYGPFPKSKEQPIGRIRRALQADSKVDPYQLAIMFAADRFAHLDDIVNPALARGETVICDRYTLSTLVYQTLKLPEEFVFQLTATARKPDLTVLLDMDPQVAMKRLIARGLPLESYERSIDTQIELRAQYMHYVNSGEYGSASVLKVPADTTAGLSPDALADYVQDHAFPRYDLLDLVVHEVPPGSENLPNKRRYCAFGAKPKYLVKVDGFNTDQPTATVTEVSGLPVCGTFEDRQNDLSLRLMDIQ